MVTGLLGFKGVINPSPKPASSSKAESYLSHSGVSPTILALMEMRLIKQLD